MKGLVRKINIVLIMMFFVLALVQACEDFEKNSYRVLVSAANIYNLSMESVADLQKKGYIKTEDREEINSIAQVYYDAYQTAIDAFEAYKIAHDTDAKNRLTTSIGLVSASLSKLVERVKPYLIESETERIRLLMNDIKGGG